MLVVIIIVVYNLEILVVHHHYQSYNIWRMVVHSLIKNIYYV